jgi:hypothetical protein
MPVWVSDFVLPVWDRCRGWRPGHDRRDFQFAKEFGIDIIRVVVGKMVILLRLQKSSRFMRKKESLLTLNF